MKIGIFTASSPYGVEFPLRARRAIDFLESKGHDVILGNLFYQKDFYRSGSIKARVDEVHDLLDKDVDVLMSAIGGWNTNSILPYLDYEKINSKKVIVTGFSDTTAILNAVLNKCPNARVFYGPSLISSFGEWEEDFLEITYQSFINNIKKQDIEYQVPVRWTEDIHNWEAKTGERKYQSNEWYFENSDSVIMGKLVGGNLNTFTGIWGSEYGPMINKGDILLIEDQAKAIDLVERLFGLLKVNKVFDKVAAVIYGKHEEFNDLGSGRTAMDVLKEVIGDQKKPLVWNVDFAHTKPMLITELGVNIEIDFKNKKITKKI